MAVVIGERHSIQCHNFHLLATQLKIGVAIRGGINDPPELTFTWINWDSRPDLSIGCTNAFGPLICRCSTPSCWYFNLANNSVLGRCVAVLDVLIPKDNYTLT